MRSTLPLTLVLTRFDENDGAHPDDYTDPETRSVKTVTALRTRLTQRAPAATSKAGRYRFVWVFVALIAATVSGYLLFPSGPTSEPEQHPPVAQKVLPHAPTAPKPTAPPAASEVPDAPPPKGGISEVATPLPTPAPAPTQIAVQNPTSSEAETTPPPQATSSPALPAIAPEQAEEKTPPLPTAPARLKLAKLVVCREVADRQPIGPQTYFRSGLSEKPHVWMTVYARHLPRKLKHVYFHEGRRYVEVPLTIRHPRTRTWSNISLTSAALAGSWRVAVMAENGEKLGEAFFEVGP